MAKYYVEIILVAIVIGVGVTLATLAIAGEPKPAISGGVTGAAAGVYAVMRRPKKKAE